MSVSHEAMDRRKRIAEHRARAAAGSTSDPSKREDQSIAVRSFVSSTESFDETVHSEAVLSRLKVSIFGADPPKDARLIRVGMAGDAARASSAAAESNAEAEHSQLSFMLRGGAEISKACLISSDGKVTSLKVTRSSVGVRLDGKAERGSLVYLVLAGSAQVGEKIEVLLMGGGRIEVR